MPIYPTRLGHYETTAVGGEVVRAYVPVSLPPIPAVDLTGLQTALELANQTVGRLDGIGSVLPAAILILTFCRLAGAFVSSSTEQRAARGRGSTHGGIGGGFAKASVSSRSSQDEKIR